MARSKKKPTRTQSKRRAAAKKAAATRRKNALAQEQRRAKRSAAAKKGWKTRRTAARKVAAKAVKVKRSAAAKKGWATRQGRAAAQPQPAEVYTTAPQAPAAPSGASSTFSREMPYFTGDAVIYVVVKYPSGALSDLGSYWYEMSFFLNNDPQFAGFDRFEGRSFYDERSRRRYDFVTDEATIRRHADLLHADDLVFPAGQESEGRWAA